MITCRYKPAAQDIKRGIWRAFPYGAKKDGREGDEEVTTKEVI